MFNSRGYWEPRRNTVSFVNKCKLKGSKVTLCPRCSAVFDKKAIEGLKKIKPRPPKVGVASAEAKLFFQQKRCLL